MIRYRSAAQLSLEGFAPFCEQLDETNRWVVLGKALRWDELAAIYHRTLSTDQGRAALDARRVIGALIIKHMLKLDDRGTIQSIKENPYQQWFCGLSAFSHEPIFDPGLMVALRKRMGVDAFDQMNRSIIQLTKPKASPAKKVKGKKDQEPPPADDPPPTHKGQLKIDATVAPQKIAYPTDLSLLNASREHTEALIDSFCTQLALKTKPRTYRRLARKAYLSVVRKKKRTRKEIRKAIGKQLRYLKRNLGHIERLWKGTSWPLDHQTLRTYWVVQEIYRQQQQMYNQRVHRVDDRIVSVHQPHVRPIVRGKATANVEFGAKINVALNDGVAWLDHLDWNAHNESEWLMHHVERYKQHYGYYPEAVNVDGIYGTRENRTKLKDLGIRFIGKALGRPSAESLTAGAKRELKQEMGQRNHIEGKFGQGKNAYGLDRIAAKRKDTSESWIAAIFFVMNLVNLQGHLSGLLDRLTALVGLLLDGPLPLNASSSAHHEHMIATVSLRQVRRALPIHTRNH